jgi:ribose/xylose/arabinose/galactoside ABC-type transport system permease subunit
MFGIWWVGDNSRVQPALEARPMAYDESTFRRRETDIADSVGVRDDLRFRGEPGFREEPDFRASPSYQTGSYPIADYGDPEPEPGPSPSPPPMPLSSGRRAAPAVLDDVFDDPEHGEPGSDRLSVHLVWEAVLLVAVAALGYLLYRDQPDALRGAGLDNLMVYGTALGLLALGAGLTLRAGAPNLALGPAAMIAALFFAKNGNGGVLVTSAVAVAVAAVAGLLIAVLVVGFQVPGWAASLAAALGGAVWIQQIHNPVRVTGGYDPTRQAVYLFGGFAVVAVLAGLLGTIKTIRRAVGRFRPVADPAKRRGAAAAGLTGLAIVVSTVLAAVAGVLFASGGKVAVNPTPGFELTGLALGAALLGGTSAFGRRGGVFGTVLVVVFVTLFVRYDAVRAWHISLFAIAAATLAGGLLVTRLIETYGRPPVMHEAMVEEDDDWVSTNPSGAGDTALSGAASEGWTSRQEAWSSALPAQSTGGRPDPWDDDRWGAAGR